MSRSKFLSIVLYGTLFICGWASSVHSVDEKKLCFAIEQYLGITDLELSPSIHGGDNKVFFVKSGTSIVCLAKCYTKRSFYDVEKNYQLLQILSKNLPIARVQKIFIFDDIPVVLQDFLCGQHYQDPSDKQLENIALRMAQIHSVVLQNNDFVINDKEFDYEELIARCRSFPDFKFIVTLYNDLDLHYLDSLPHAFIHGDISASNLLFIDDEISGIIDFDHARYAYRLTDIARAQVFFAFDAQGNLNENKVRQFVTSYQKNVTLSLEELSNFYNHLQLLLIKMVLETYYYVEVIKEVSPDIFNTSSYNQSWQLLLKKLHAIVDRSSLVV